MGTQLTIDEIIEVANRKIRVKVCKMIIIIRLSSTFLIKTTGETRRFLRLGNFWPKNEDQLIVQYDIITSSQWILQEKNVMSVWPSQLNRDSFLCVQVSYKFEVWWNLSRRSVSSTIGK